MSRHYIKAGWPLLLVAIGTGIVIGALSREDERRGACECGEPRHE